MPGRHTSESGPTSPASHFFLTSPSGSGPTWACPIATYHSVVDGDGAAPANTFAASSAPMAWVEPRSASAPGAAVAGGVSPKAWSNALPSSASRPPLGVTAGRSPDPVRSTPGAVAPLADDAGPVAAGAAKPGAVSPAGGSATLRTRMTCPHFLQRTLTPA